MNKKLIFSVLLVVCLLAVVSVVVFAQSSPNVRWEYTTIGDAPRHSGFLNRANQLGQQGWEFVGTDDTSSVFKRRLP